MSMDTRHWRVIMMTEGGRVTLLELQNKMNSQFAEVDARIDWGKFGALLGMGSDKWVDNKMEEIDELYLQRCRWCGENTVEAAEGGMEGGTDVMHDLKRSCDCKFDFGFEDMGVENFHHMSPLAGGMAVGKLLKGIKEKKRRGGSCGSQRAATASPRWVYMFSTWGSLKWWKYAAMKTRTRRGRLKGILGEWYQKTKKDGWVTAGRKSKLKAAVRYKYKKWMSLGDVFETWAYGRLPKWKEWKERKDRLARAIDSFGFG